MNQDPSLSQLQAAAIRQVLDETVGREIQQLRRRVERVEAAVKVLQDRVVALEKGAERE